MFYKEMQNSVKLGDTMNLLEFEKQYKELGYNPKTAIIDKYNKKLIKEKVDVSFLKTIIAEHEEYYRTYFQVSIATRKTLEEKFTFIEENFHLLHDWWHVDILMGFLGNSITFEYAFMKAQQYVKSEMPYVRRFGYVMFIPRLVKDENKLDDLLSLLGNDDEYHVIMGEAWLLSYIAMCDTDKAYEYIKNCDLKYNIIGKAIQKICDSYVISKSDKERFKALRPIRKKKYILFDLDGTITKSDDGITKCLQYALGKMGIIVENREELQVFIGPPLLKQFMEYGGFNVDEAQKAVEYYRERYTKTGMFENSLYPGIEDMLKQLKKRGYSLAVASSKPEKYVKQILEYFNVDHYFDEIAGATMDETRNTKTAVIEEALRRLGIGKNRNGIFMVGDKEHDIIGAKNTGIPCVAVTYGYGGRNELENANPLKIVDSVNELEEYLLNNC